MKMEPKFITKNDFFRYHNINLEEKLKGGANPSNKVDAFLFKVERRVMTYIDNNSFRNYDFDKLKGDTLEAFQLALLEQALYMYKNGDLAMDSGYDMEKGIIAPGRELKKIIICEPTIEILQNNGLLNLKTKHNRRIIRSLL